MDTSVIMNPYVLAVLILLVSLIFVFFMILRKPEINGCSNVKSPQGSRGLPLVGETILHVLSGPQKFFRERIEKYSPYVFQTTLFGEKLAVFCGPEGNKILFNNENKLVRSWWPLSARMPLYSSEFADASTDEIVAVLVGFVHDILKPEVLKKYVPVMDSIAREHVESNWAGKDFVELLPTSKKYTFSLSCKFLLNVVDDEHITMLAKHFVPVANGIYSVPVDLPGTAYNRAIKGGKLVREELIKIINKKRNEMLMENNSDEKSVIGDDLLSRLLMVTDEHGKHLSAKEVCNNIIGFLFASYETPGLVMTSLFKCLAELPHIYNEVYKEQMEIANSKKEKELLKWEDIQKMKYSWNVVCEVLRLLPSGQAGFREAIIDFNYAGFTIPKGMKTYWTTNTTHNNPEYFPDPEKFDPSRFEGNQIAPYTFVPFGGGSRMCPGKEYARLEILVFLHYIVTKFRPEKVSSEKILYVFPSPTKDGLLRLIPHKK